MSERFTSIQEGKYPHPVSHSLGQRVQGRGVDFPPDVDVDGRRVPGGGRHHRDALPHPSLPFDVRHTGHYLIARVSVTCHQAECWVMTLCPMLLRLFSLRDWPVVPAVAGDWALVAGPGALSSLSSLSSPGCSPPPALGTHHPHRGQGQHRDTGAGGH